MKKLLIVCMCALAAGCGGAEEQTSVERDRVMALSGRAGVVASVYAVTVDRVPCVVVVSNMGGTSVSCDWRSK